MCITEQHTKDELDHFYKEREKVQEEIKQAKDNSELMHLRQRLMMICEVIKVKKERLRGLDSK